MFGKNNFFGSSGSSIMPGRDPVKEIIKKVETEVKIVKALVESPEAGTKKTVKRIREALKEDEMSHLPSSDTPEIIKLIKGVMGEKVIEKVLPLPGCIIYCELGPAEHTGVYINSSCIAELNGDGCIKGVTPGNFLDSSLYRTGTKIFIACDRDGIVLHSSTIAERASRMLGKSRSYNLVLDNCHQFTCGCILDNFENPNNFFWMVEHTVSTEMNSGESIKWIPWDRKY